MAQIIPRKTVNDVLKRSDFALSQTADYQCTSLTLFRHHSAPVQSRFKQVSIPTEQSLNRL